VEAPVYKMKRIGNLYPLIAEPENLRLAFLKSVRGKRGKADVRAYAARLDENLQALRNQLLFESGQWTETDLARHMEALLSYVRFADTLALRREIIGRVSLAA
jgi:hypothetical protein